MADKDERPTSQHVRETASYGAISMDGKTAKQLSSSGTRAQRTREANKRLLERESQLKESGTGSSAAGSSKPSDKGA